MNTRIKLGKSRWEIEEEIRKNRLFRKQQRKCKVCHEPFSPKSIKQIYCSKECRKKAWNFYTKEKMGERRIIEKLSKMTHRQVKKFQELALKQQFVEDVLIINNKKCYICSSTDNLIKHHISYNPEETVILCRKCHSILHRIILHGKKCRPRDF